MGKMSVPTISGRVRSHPRVAYQVERPPAIDKDQEPSREMSRCMTNESALSGPSFAGEFGGNCSRRYHPRKSFGREIRQIVEMSHEFCRPLSSVLQVRVQESACMLTVKCSSSVAGRDAVLAACGSRGWRRSSRWRALTELVAGGVNCCHACLPKFLRRRSRSGANKKKRCEATHNRMRGKSPILGERRRYANFRRVRFCLCRDYGALSLRSC